MNLKLSNQGFVDYWARVGPQLERIRREELRRFDYKKNWQLVDSLLQIACSDTTPRPTSGLVELQRFFQQAKGK